MQAETDGNTADSPGTGIFHPMDQIHQIGQCMQSLGGLDVGLSYSRVSLGQHDLPIL